MADSSWVTANTQDGCQRTNESLCVTVCYCRKVMIQKQKCPDGRIVEVK